MAVRTFRLAPDATLPAIGQEIDCLEAPLKLLMQSAELVAAEMGESLRDAAILFTGNDLVLEVILANGDKIIRPIARRVFKGRTYIVMTNLTNVDKE